MSCANESAEQVRLFDEPGVRVSPTQFASPKGYKGLAAFHKYWGKKPVECVSFLTEVLTRTGETVLDPFLGSGLIARESVTRDRPFVGMDVNPVAIEMAKLQLSLPDSKSLLAALARIEAKALGKINSSYERADTSIATHFLWRESELEQVWIVARGKGARVEYSPSEHDLQKYRSFESYEPKNVRPLKLFKNSRINACDSFSWKDLFTGRALHNIDLIVAAIREEPEEIQRALMLSLTSAAGQMSRMVFAITGRGKSTGAPSTKIEVGSWVIGFWRPKLHFEINVWRCFEKRVKGLVKAIEELNGPRGLPYFSALPSCFTEPPAAVFLNEDCKKGIDSLEPDSVGLVLTDPPHSDRIPYLELSEVWNALLGCTPQYADEIVVSNAKVRGKTKQKYTTDMKEFVHSAVRVLKPGRFLAVMFNARDASSWRFLSECVEEEPGLELCGSVPMTYSAGSVVQDNRTGGLKSDYVILYRKRGDCGDRIDLSPCRNLPGWLNGLPARVLQSEEETSNG